MNEFIAEETLAKRLGLNRDALRPMRPENARTYKNAVEWPWAEAERVARLLNLDLAAEETGAEKTAAEETLTVASTPGRDGWHFGNHNLIRARRASGEVVVVRVVDSKKYAPILRGGQPMVFKARKSDGHWWQLVGREPRWKGMW